MMFTTMISLLLLILPHLGGCHKTPKHRRPPRRPPKMDIGFIVDISPDMPPEGVHKAAQLMRQFGNRLSVSSGTTRFALLTINSTGVHKHFLFPDVVNRECLMREIRKLSNLQSPTISGKDKISGEKGFTRSLKKAVGILKSSSHQILDQQIVYFLVTHSVSRMKMVKSDKIGAPYELLTVLVGPQNEIILKNISTKFFWYEKKTDFQAIQEVLELEEKVYSSCSTKGSVRDECNRECSCINGTLKKCFRIRKEFTEMTSQEQRDYLKAYKYMTTTSPYKERYHKLVFKHFRYFCHIHLFSLFLPWHRWYLSQMEDLLREIDCRVTVPYWDWSAVSEDAWNVPKLWSKDGLGGGGDEKKGFCVQDGMFRQSKWTTPYWEDPFHIIKTTVDQMDGDIANVNLDLDFCLRRGMHGTPPSVNSIRNVLKIPPKRFHDFNMHIIHHYHNNVHDLIGGTMCTEYSANAPEFWFHHGFLDKIWYMWQQKSNDHKYVHFLQRNVTKMMGSKYTRRDYIDSHSLPRCTRVKYSKFPYSTTETTVRRKRAVNDTAESSSKIDRKEISDYHTQREINRNIEDREIEKSFISVGYKVEPIDDIGRTPFMAWDRYMKKKWERDFPWCKSSQWDEPRMLRFQRIVNCIAKLITTRGLSGQSRRECFTIH